MEDSQETQGQAPAPAAARPQSMWHEGLGQDEGEDKSSKRRMFSQIPQAMPLRTWLVILLVVVSGLGITGSSFAVNSIMRNVLFNNVDDELRSASTTWARDISNDFFICLLYTSPSPRD